MFANLPNLFDRNFAMAYFLPTTVFVGVLCAVADLFVKGLNFVAYFQADVVVGATLLVVVSWLGSIFLLVTNSKLYQFFEGYGPWNPLRLFRFVERTRYRKLMGELRELQTLQNSVHAYPGDLVKRWRVVMFQLANRFDSGEEHILPTALGT